MKKGETWKIAIIYDNPLQKKKYMECIWYHLERETLFIFDSYKWGILHISIMV